MELEEHKSDCGKTCCACKLDAICLQKHEPNNEPDLVLRREKLPDNIISCFKEANWPPGSRC